MSSHFSTFSEQPDKIIERYNNFYRVLRQRYDTLSPRLRQIADFVISNPEDFALGTAKALSEAAGVQPSTMVRFAHTFGFESFSEMHVVFKHYFLQSSLYHKTRADILRQTDGQPARAESLLDGFYQAAQLSCDSLCQDTRPDHLESAADILASARTIYILGLKSCMPLARLFSYYFTARGISHVVIGLESGMEEEAFLKAGPEDAAVVLSFAPYFERTTQLARLMEHYGVSIVALTDQAVSPVIPATGFWLECHEAEYRGFRFNLPALLLVTALACAVSERRRPFERKMTPPDESSATGQNSE